MGRELQQMMGQRPQQILLMPLLIGTDGRQKMSKSLDNYIGVDDPPNDMYGKAMSIRDELISEYFWLLTDAPEEELAEMDRAIESSSVNPMELKKRLSYDIAHQFHGQRAAASAQEHFERVFQRAEVPEEMPTVRFRSLGEGQGYLFYTDSGPVNVRLARRRADNTPLADRVPAAEILCKLKLASSTSEAKRLLAQGSVEADGERVRMSIKLSDGLVIRVGRRRFVRLVEADE